jgi:hypothetical protein
MRQGLKELRAALYPDSPIAREAEMGTWGTVTPSEVVEQRRQGAQPMHGIDPNQAMPEQQHSIVDERIQQAQEHTRGHEHEQTQEKDQGKEAGHE